MQFQNESCVTHVYLLPTHMSLSSFLLALFIKKKDLDLLKKILGLTKKRLGLTFKKRNFDLCTLPVHQGTFPNHIVQVKVPLPHRKWAYPNKILHILIWTADLRFHLMSWMLHETCDRNSLPRHVLSAWSF